MGKVLIEVETDKPIRVASYLDEVLKQVKRNKYLALKSYQISIENEKP